jgi:thiol-disulfide isomerase/thioredoxin
MRTLRLPIRLLWIPSIALLGCTGIMPDRSNVAPQVNTIAWVGDKPMPVVSGVPGDSVSSGAAEPKRPDDKESRISGRVFDVRGNPVPNARVRLAIRGESGGRVVRATTDQSGGFTLHGLRPGSSYTLIAETDDRDGVLTGRAQAQVPSTQVKIKLSDLQDAPTARLPGQISTIGRPAADEADGESDQPAASARPRRINNEDLPPAPEAEALAPAAAASRTGRGIARLAAPLPGSRWHRGDKEDDGTEAAVANRSATTSTEAIATSAEERTPQPAPGAQPASEPGPRSSPASVPERRSDPRAGSSSESEGPSAAQSKPAKEPESALPAPALPAPDDDDEGPNPLPPAIEPGKAQAPSEPAPSPGNTGPPAASESSATSKSEPGVPAPSSSSNGTAPSASSGSAGPEAGETTSGQPASEPLPPATLPASQGDSAAAAPAAPDSILAALTASAPPSARVAAKPPLLQPQIRSIAYDPFALKGAAPLEFASNNAEDQTVIPATSNDAPQASKRPTWGELTAKHPELAVALPVGTLASPRSAVGLGRRDQPPSQPPAAGTPAPKLASAPSLKDAGVFKATCRYDARRRQLVDFRLPDLQGQPVRFQDLNSDFVLLDFWGTWCGYCIQSIPHLVALQKQLGADKLIVVGIAYEQGPTADRVSAVRDVSQRLGINYQVLLGGIDGPCPLQEAFNVQAFPTMVLVDRDGRVLWRDTGATPSTLDRLDRVIASATKGDVVRR